MHQITEEHEQSHQYPGTFDSSSGEIPQPVPHFD